jgi:membrane associated rhomboid family serine protease
MMISMLVIMLVDEAGMALNIGHESHLAGAVVGVILALVWPQNKRSSVNKEFEGEENDS